ncbi:MAG: hypothetical protein PHO02_03185 [Candidatus Nanoarchaeia archaeon]|nr:hypothetical protein [Candidatus Nanoarchaeia archaeon]
MKIKTILAFMAVFALMAAFASARFEDLEITGPGIEQAAAGSTIKVILTINNKGSDNLILGVSRDPFATLESSWFESIMFSPNTFKLDGLDSRELEISIKFKKTVPTDSTYQTAITFYQLDKPELKKDFNLMIRAVSPENILKAKIEADEMVMPGKNYKAKITVENNLNAVLPESEIVVASELFEERRSIILTPWQERAETFEFPIKDNEKPGAYTASIRVYYDKQLVSKKEVDFTVTTVSDVGGDEQIEEGFLWKRISVTRQGSGNTPTETTYRKTLSSFEKLFASYSPEPTEDEGDSLKWALTVNPGTTQKVIITINYRPAFWAALAIIAFTVFALFIFRRGVSLKKEIISHKTTHDGFTEIKARIHIKNHDKKYLHDAVLIEVLPHHMHPKMEFSTLHPEAVEKGEKGIRIRWHLDKVAGHEERIITYTVLTKIGIIGDIEMQPTLLRYKSKEGKVISVKSNKVSFISGHKDIAPKHKIEHL